MPDKEILQFDHANFETELDRLVSRRVEELLNAMLDAEADELTASKRYERTDGRRAYCAGHYERGLTVKAGSMTLRVPKLKGAFFDSQIIDRYRRREESVDEALIEMYLKGVSTRGVDDISQALWGCHMAPETLSDQLKPVYMRIDQWRQRALEHSYPYVFMDGVWHKRSWGGAIENVSVLVAIGIDDTGHREVIGITEGMKEDTESWKSFIRSMLDRGLKGVRLAVGDRNPGLVRALGELLPEARYQRCMVHFERNILCKTPTRRSKQVAASLKAIFSMENRTKTLEKAESVATELDNMKLKEAASCLREGISEATTYMLDEYPREHWRLIRTNNMIERLNREIRRRTRKVGAFPNAQSALMLITARVKDVTANWNNRRYLNMSLLEPTIKPTNENQHTDDQH